MDGANDARPSSNTSDMTSKYAIYASYSFATWGWRTWEFAVVLILLHFYPDSLVLVSVYGMLESLVAVICGSAVGSYIDRTPRLRGACMMYVLQNTCVVVSALSAGSTLVLDHWHGRHQMRWALVGLTIAAGGASSAGSQGVRVAVEKDWVKCLCGSDAAALTRMNSGMRAVDLSCLLLAPVVSGLLMTYAGLGWAVGAILAFNSLAALPEVLLLRSAYLQSASLREPRLKPSYPMTAAHQQRPTPLPWAAKLRTAVSGWGAFTQQAALRPAVALALLYCTVLSLGYQMTSYLTWRHISEAQVAGIRSLGALSGLAASALFPSLSGRVGVKVAGFMGIWWQLGCLVVGVAPTALKEVEGWAAGKGGWEIYVLLGALVGSRFGLWMFDLAVTQLLQDMVAANQLGAVCGVQDSLQSALGLLAYTVGLGLHRPPQFIWLMLASLVFVAAAALLYTSFLVAPPRSGPRYQQLDEDDATGPLLLLRSGATTASLQLSSLGESEVAALSRLSTQDLEVGVGSGGNTEGLGKQRIGGGTNVEDGRGGAALVGTAGGSGARGDAGDGLMQKGTGGSSAGGAGDGGVGEGNAAGAAAGSGDSIGGSGRA